MKKIIEELITKDGKDYKRITTVDERWYIKDEKLYPSSTWISSFYPKGTQFYKWLASKGWDEAEAIKISAGEKGSKVHLAIQDLIAGKEIRMENSYPNPNTGILEELKLEEYECVMSFKDFVITMKPEFLASEIAVFNEEYTYAGTGDIIAKIDNDIVVIDIKTGSSIWPESELQVSSYFHSDDVRKFKANKLAILQVNYKLNKNKWKYTELEDKFDLFLSARKIWENETKNIVPLQKDYPLSVKL